MPSVLRKQRTFTIAPEGKSKVFFKKLFISHEDKRASIHPSARSWHNREPNILFDAQGLIAGLAYKELTQYYPQKSWLEHNADEIWQSTQALLQQVLQDTGIRASRVAAIGLSVQRETCLLWDKTTGEPLHNAIVTARPPDCSIV